DPSKSGVKFVQAISMFQKRFDMGSRCKTIRTEESNVASGWQLDGDPLSTELLAINYFSVLGSPVFPGSTFGIAAHDSPGSALTSPPLHYLFRDTFYEDDRFETYVVYFTGNDPAHPPLQRPIGKLNWNWGGLVFFDPDRHRIRYTLAPPGLRIGQATTAPMVTMQGNWTSNPDIPCPGENSLSTNRNDSSRELVRYFYWDILRRSPDSIGWNNWTSNVAQCMFDWNCRSRTVCNVALGFLWSDEFRQRIAQEDPVMASGTGPEYNRRFVYWCYRTFLDRIPDQTGWDNWTNTLNANGDYAAVVFGFVYSSEYRNLPPRPN